MVLSNETVKPGLAGLIGFFVFAIDSIKFSINGFYFVEGYFGC